MSLPCDNYSLYECSACNFVFKHPRIPLGLLTDAYSRSDGFSDDLASAAHRFSLIKTLFHKHANGCLRVLDIGCDDGKLLDYLDLNVNFGIEPCKSAARAAENKGVVILGSSVEDACNEAHSFDGILAIDVAEHVPEPMPFFASIAQLLAPGGILVVVTGDTASWPWRLLGARYWYPCLIEHVSFFSARTLREVAAQLGMEMIEVVRAPHNRGGSLAKLKELLKFSIYLGGICSPVARLPHLSKYFAGRASPLVVNFRDHCFSVLKKL